MQIFAGVPPFANTPEANLINVVADRGMRPPRPDQAETRKLGLGDGMWGLIEASWTQEPNRRPSAPTIAQRLGTLRAAPSSEESASDVNRPPAALLKTKNEGKGTLLKFVSIISQIMHM